MITLQNLLIGVTIRTILFQVAFKISCRFMLAFVVFFGSNLVLTLFATVITAFIAPAAAGSGIPEVKAYLNGVDAPGIYTLRTLFVKVC